ncbi:MAG: pilus assembly protein PilM, partial [candidate division Zixibacteria bacterium]|nr:pilus assembly protein PilM [candidate division Zixibacteria bacterium]
DISRVAMLSEMEPAESRADHVSMTVAEYVSRFGGSSPEIDLVVTGRETAFRCFLMPILKKGALESAIQFEARKQIPFPLDDCIFDYRRTFRILGNQRSRYRIALHAATARMIKEQLEPFRQKGLVVNRVVNADEAVGYMLDRMPDFDESAVYCLVEVSQDRCKIAYYRGTALEFLHTGAVGTAQLGDQPDITRIEYFAENLANELTVSQDYYAGQYAKALPDKVYICGELAARCELVELLNGKTPFEYAPFPADSLDVFRGHKIGFGALLPQCLPVLAAATARTHLCNLLPRKIRQQQLTRNVDRLSRLSLLLLGLTLMTGWAYLRMSVDNTTIIAESLEQQAAEALQSEAYNSHRALLQQIAFDRAYLKKTEAAEGYLNYNLKELSLLTSPPVSLYRLEYDLRRDAPGMALYGRVTSSDVPPEVILAQYIEKLRASPFYRDITLVRHSKRKVRNEFLIDFQIEMEGVA